jgi:anthranilate synthase component 1
MFSYQTKSKTILADLYTPVSAYLRVRDSYPQSALMESSDYHGGENSRSFIGFNPLASISISHGKAISKMPDGSTIEKAISENYRVDLAINDFLHQIKVTGDNSNFCGLYGYTSFNAVRYFENIAVKCKLSGSAL